MHITAMGLAWTAMMLIAITQVLSGAFVALYVHARLRKTDPWWLGPWLPLAWSVVWLWGIRALSS